MIVGVNKYNLDNYIRVFYKASESSPFIYLAQMSLVGSVTCPSDGTFVDASYTCSFGAVAASHLRFIITRDGVNPKELTPVKRYKIYNNGVAVVGGSKFEVNSLGWQTGEVFKTIFTYLEAPISVEHKVNIETETEGLLPEARIRNDNLLARLADNELISGVWSFESGQIIVSKGNALPTGAIAQGRLFFRTSDNSFFVGDGSGWLKLVREDELANKVDFAWGFTRPSLVSAGTFLKYGDTPLSINEGMPLPHVCKLSGAVLYVTTTVMDGSGIEILKNGVVVANCAINNGTKMGDASMNVTFNYKDFVAVRASSANQSSLDSPRVSLLFKSA
jgi:hypothetical protein